MNTYEKIDNSTQTAERLVRAVQGFCLLAALAHSKPLVLGGRAITLEDASRLIFDARVCILALDVGKDVYRIGIATGNDRAFKDFRDRGELCTFDNVSDMSGLIVDIATAGTLLTDTLGLITPNRLTAFLDIVCDPALAILYLILFRQADSETKIAKTSFDLVHCLAPYFLVKWADKITPVTLVVTGLYGAYAVWQ